MSYPRSFPRGSGNPDHEFRMRSPGSPLSAGTNGELFDAAAYFAPLLRKASSALTCVLSPAKSRATCS